MSKLSRFTQLLFGTSSGTNTMEEFGSIASSYPSVPTRYSGATITPALVQALSNFQSGWPGGVVAGNAPCIESMNALHYLAFYQLAYLFQAGIPEYDASTTYYQYSFCQYNGIVYQSLIDSNLGNTPSSTIGTDWAIFGNKSGPSVQKFLSGSGTYTTPAGVKYIRVRAVGGGGGGAGAGGWTAGADTTFGVITAGAGQGSVSSSYGGAGGTASLGAGPIGLAVSGGDGASGASYLTGGYNGVGGNGGSSALGGGGVGAQSASAGGAGKANTGGGGGGGIQTSGESGSPGGGAGGFVDAIINSPAATYSYAVGAGGAGGTGGGINGGSGGSGGIWIEEHYS